MTVGERVMGLRCMKLMTRAELAYKMKRAPSGICKFELETRRPTRRTLAKLASVFNVTVDYLVNGGELDYLLIPYIERGNMYHVELKKVRETFGMTVYTLSELTGLSTTELYFIENKTHMPKLDTIRIICETLEITEEELRSGRVYIS